MPRLQAKVLAGGATFSTFTSPATGETLVSVEYALNAGFVFSGARVSLGLAFFDSPARFNDYIFGGWAHAGTGM